MAEDPIPMVALTDFSQTKRIVFLIDLDPLLRHQNPNSYLNCILSSAKVLLSSPPLSSSLFSFKPFFASLSPLLSSSKLRNLSLNLSFNDPDSTLESLRETLESVAKLAFSGPLHPPQATNVATSMRQLLHDYSWDLFMDDDVPSGTPLVCHNVVKPNLIVMFSPIDRTKRWLSEFMGAEIEEGLFNDMDLFCNKFSSFFRSVGDSFLSKDIHFSWIDVKYDLDGDNPEMGTDESVNFGFFESAIRSLGWGFCSTQSIVSGSIILPFGLIYPSIGISPKVFDFNACGKRIRAHLGLEISDAKGKPLVCKCCKLELVSLKFFAADSDCGLLLSAKPTNLHVGVHEDTAAYLEHFMDGVVKVKAVQKHDKFAKFEEGFLEPFIAREYTEKSSGIQKDGSFSEFFADRVLELLASEMGEVVQKSPPNWQIFLGFMYREGYSALVSLSKGNGDKVFGILKPFTSSLALISLRKKKSCPGDWFYSIGGVALHRSGKNCSRDSQIDRDGHAKKEKTRKSMLVLKNLTWSAFQKGKYEDSNIKLEELYFARETNKTKKLLFMKYWMKQLKVTDYSCLSQLDGFGPQEDTPNKTENEQPLVASTSCGEHSTTADLRVENEVAFDQGLKSSDILGEIPNKIRQGVESEGIDMGTLAERLVNSAIYWLQKKSEIKVASESQSQSEKSDEGSGSKVISELVKLLLRDPKDLEEKSKGTDQTADPYTVREYELQICFRMEIMRSELSASIKGSVKQRFVKQICLLLESIQCRLEAFFGDWNLHDYVEKTIKSRYFKDLEEAVHQIYSKMDLLFEDEDELPNSLLNSEENSDQPWKHKVEKQKMDKEEGRNKCSPRAKGGEYMQRLTEAQGKRERARRFASLTTWQPDLQRVWAPKNPKAAMKVKLDLSRKTSKRRYRNDVVCETPMTQNKRCGARLDGSPDQDYGGQCSSVFKALFSDTSD